MLSINKIYCYLFVLALLIQIPSICMLKFLDELLVVFMLLLISLDVVVNKQYKKYRLLWGITGVMFFYALYSILFLSYNTPKAIMYDFIAQMKPFCYFCIGYAVTPMFDVGMKRLLKWICVINSVIVLFCFILGLTNKIFAHVTYLGLVSFVSFLVFLLCSCDEEGKVAKSELVKAIIILSIGLVCTRSKFYGEYLFTLYLLFLYVPGYLKKIKIKQIVIALLALCLVLIVTWHKIDYYFISGGQDVSMDEEVLQTFARPVMYASMIVILGMHPLLGSGLASFGTNASTTAVNYASTYGKIGIDNIWGLSESYDEFICDAFYTELAQFGIIGIALFVYFFVWLNKRLSLFLYVSGKMFYVIGVISIIVILIESIASTTFNQGAGAMYMMILGILTSYVKNITKTQELELKKQSYKEIGALDYIKK